MNKRTKKKAAIAVLVLGPALVLGDRLLLSPSGDTPPGPAVSPASAEADPNQPAAAPIPTGPSVRSLVARLSPNLAEVMGPSPSPDGHRSPLAAISQVFASTDTSPFASPSAEPEPDPDGPAGITCTAVTTAAGGAAVLNGTLVRVGGEINGVRLLAVDGRTATVLVGDEEHTLELD